MQRIWPAFVLVAACSSTGNSPRASGKGLALVASNLATASAVSLVDASSSQVAVADCLDSSSVTSLSPALSADVVLPTAPQPDHRILLIDRAHSSLIWLLAPTCQLSRQLDVGGDFQANPGDVAAVSDTKAYVTRPATNPTPSGVAGVFDVGNDL